jgi:branched-chain amino acid transport system substrate-binding protein
MFCLTLILPLSTSAQEPAYPGVTSTEIRIGTITCVTGWAKAYASVSRAEAAYFQMVNERGGINGRKVKFISLDDGCESSRSLALAQQLIEQENVLLLFSTLGTETNLAIRSYLNEKHVPQLFVESSSAVFDDPSHFPWTMGFFATYASEGRAYANYILKTKPTAKIGVLSANDDVGREYVSGLRAGLGNKASMIGKELTYNATDGSLDAQLQALRDSGADVFVNFSVGPFATQSIGRAFDLNWHPLQFIPNASLSIFAFLEPAGLNKSAGIISNARSKGWLRGQGRQDPKVAEFLEWMRKYNPQGNLRDQNNVAGYERAQTLVAILQKCGSDLSRSNVMKEAASLDLELGMLRPGIRIQTSPSDYQPIKELFLIRFDGTDWSPIGPISTQ